MNTFTKSLVATATATLGNDNIAAALTSSGRAFASGENATKRLVKVYADTNTHPAFFVSPYDNTGKVNDKSLSRATPEQFDAQRMLFAAGMGAASKGLDVTTCVELLAYDIEAKRKRLAIIKETVKNTKDSKAKAKLCNEAEVINDTLKARSMLQRKIGPKFRDLANALITEYKRRTKASQGNEQANELAATMKEECGFKSIKDKETKEDKPSKDGAEVMKQHALNLLHSLQSAEVLPLKAKDNVTLIKLLSELTEPAN